MRFLPFFLLWELVGTRGAVADALDARGSTRADRRPTPGLRAPARDLMEIKVECAVAGAGQLNTATCAKRDSHIRPKTAAPAAAQHPSAAAPALGAPQTLPPHAPGPARGPAPVPHPPWAPFTGESLKSSHASEGEERSVFAHQMREIW